MDDPEKAGLTPEPLVDLCLCAICPQWPSEPLRRGSSAPLPAEICDRLFEKYYDYREALDDSSAHFFDRGRTRLRSVRLRPNHHLTEDGMRVLLDHQLEELEYSEGTSLTHMYLDSDDTCFSNLKTLRMSTELPPFKFPKTARKNKLFPKLNKLISIGHVSDMYTLDTLSHLEVSKCQLCIVPSPTLPRFESLASLVLYDVQWMKGNVDWICTLRNLEHLDISHHREGYGQYGQPNEALAVIVQSLPKLKSLDISGTNLAGTGSASAYDESPYPCDIPGLSSRVRNPLNFLGLYGTAHSACYRHDIPALKISGHANEEQILTAATLYMSRPEILTRVLNDLYHLFRNDKSDSKRQWETLNIILKAMNMHIFEKHIQICGSATLFYIVKGKKSDLMGVKLKRYIITTLLKALEFHTDDSTMMRNGCLTLCQFKVPNDVIFEYERVVYILLTGVSSSESFVQRVAIYLLNSFACQVEAIQKRYLGDMGVIRKLLSLIEDRLKRTHFDDVLEVAWSTMWNVTDETPINCQRFLDNDGLTLFVNCLKIFPDKEELLRNMMGLLGNVAEVKDLRSILMQEFLISEFVDLLDSLSDGIEVSYNAAGVLAHLASDGKNAWTIKTPTREEVLSKMVSAIRRWNLKSRRNINYRSLEPLIGLLKIDHTPECQHWAIWAMANLTTVYPEKYCSLVEAENGIKLINHIYSFPFTNLEIKNLAQCVITNCDLQKVRD